MRFILISYIGFFSVFYYLISRFDCLARKPITIINSINQLDPEG